MSYSSIETVPRFFVATAIVIWLAIEPCQGQSRDVAFGAIQRIRTPEKFERARFVTGTRRENQRILLWSVHRPEFYLVTLDSSLSTISSQEFVAPLSFDDILTADFNNDGKVDLLFVNKSERCIVCVTKIAGDTLKPFQRIDLSFEPNKIVLGDVNNDRAVDIVPIDLRTPGVVPFMNDGRGHFKPGRAIAQDNSIADLAFAHFNNDKVVDIVFYDWVKSELHLLYGVGRGRFLDQSVFPVEGDVKELLTLERGREGLLDFVLVMKKPHELQYWEGDGLGDFKKKSVLLFPEDPVGIALADVDNDRFKDMIVLFQGRLEVYFNSSGSAFGEKSEFSAVSTPTQLLVSDVNGDGRSEAVVTGKDNLLTVYFNAEQRNILTDSLEFVTGVGPAAVWVGDANFDGIPDVGVLNEQSNSLSIFFGRSKEGLLGQTSYTLANSPRYLSYHSGSDSVSNFLVSYPSAKSVSFLALNPFDNSTVNAVIPSDGESEVLSTSTSGGVVEFFCSNAASSTQDASLSYYLRIGPQAFLERSYRLASPDALLGVTVNRSEQDSTRRFVYVYRTTENKNLEVGVAVLDTSLEVRERLVAHELPPSPDRKCYLWTADLDKDDTLDVVLSFPNDSKKLFVLRGLANRTFDEPRLVLENVSLSDRLQLRIVDVDGDGLPDIIVCNQMSNSIGWVKNNGNMIFWPWQEIYKTEPGSHFSVGDVDRDKIPDIAVSLTQSGSLKLLNGRMFWSARNAHRTSQ